jgi:hypothetical protein
MPHHRDTEDTEDIDFFPGRETRPPRPSASRAWLEGGPEREQWRAGDGQGKETLLAA